MSKRTVVSAAAAMGTDKKKNQKEPLSREERKTRGKEKRQRKEQGPKPIPVVREGSGLTLAQLQAMDPFRKPAQPAESPDATMEQEFVAALTNNLNSCFGITTPAQEPVQQEPVQVEINSEDEELPITALRKAVTDEIQRILATTQPLFDCLRDSSEMAEEVAGILFEEGGPLSEQLADVLVSDKPAEAIADLLEEVGSNVYFLQLVTSSFQPEYELKQLEGVDPEVVYYIRGMASREAASLNLRQRFEEIQSDK